MVKVKVIEKLPRNPKTNPKPNPKPNRGEFSGGAIVWLPPNPKTNPHLGPNRNPNWGQYSSGGGGQLSGYQYFFTSIALLTLLMKPLYVFRNRYWFFWSLKVNTKISNYYLKFKPSSRAIINCKIWLPFLKFWNYSYNTEHKYGTSDNFGKKWAMSGKNRQM